MNPDNPMIVQSDRTILLEVDHPQHAEARDALAQFAELEKSPEHIHTYRLSPLSLWNAAAGGMNAQEILDLLTRYSKYTIPSNIGTDIREYISRYGRIKLVRDGDALLLKSEDMALIAALRAPTGGAGATRTYQAGAYSYWISRRRPGGIYRRLVPAAAPASRDAAGQDI